LLPAGWLPWLQLMLCCCLLPGSFLLHVNNLAAQLVSCRLRTAILSSTLPAVWPCWCMRAPSTSWPRQPGGTRASLRQTTSAGGSCWSPLGGATAAAPICSTNHFHLDSAVAAGGVNNCAFFVPACQLSSVHMVLATWCGCRGAAAACFLSGPVSGGGLEVGMVSAASIDNMSAVDNQPRLMLLMQNWRSLAESALSVQIMCMLVMRL